MSAPEVIHFAGHMIAPPGVPGRFPAAREAEIAAAIRARLREHPADAGYGALACGSDILVAETLLDAGAELHAVLPFDAEAFVAASVAPGGADWVPRFRRCLAAAASVRIAATGGMPDRDWRFVWSSRLAMGLAILHARRLGRGVRQFAVWDGTRPSGPAGTAADVVDWRARGLPSEIVPLGADEGPTDSAVRSLRDVGLKAQGAQAILYGQVTLPDSGRLADEILVRMVALAGPYGAAFCGRQIDGDGLRLMFDDPVEAARCALDMSRELAGRDPSRDVEETRPALQIVCDYGVFAGRGGRAASFASQALPAAPTGAVWLTEAMAAALALAGPPGLVHDAAAAAFGTVGPGYLLRETG